MITTKFNYLGAVTAIITLGISMNAFGFLGFGDSASWKEEILLHDGTTIIAERKQTYGGKPTIDSRERALIDEEWIFPIPNGKGSVTWKNNFRNPPEGQSLMLMLVDFVGDVAYLATSPAGCIAYNHWGRPNPPYVLFRYDGKQWQRISLAEFPAKFRESNVVVGRPDPNHRSGTLTHNMVKQDNAGLEPYHRAISREVLPAGSAGVSCEEQVYYKGAWVGPGDSIGKRMMDRRTQQENTSGNTNSENRGER